MDQISSIRSAVNSVFGQRRNHRVGVCNAGLVESEGRVWVEVGNSSCRNKDGGGLKLRVIHLHPENPAIALAIQQYRDNYVSNHASEKQLQQNNKEMLVDMISLSSQEDFWFNHWQGPAISLSDPLQPQVLPNEQQHQLLPDHQQNASIKCTTMNCSTCKKKVLINTAVTPPTIRAPSPRPSSPVLAHVPSLRRSSIGLSSPSSPSHSSVLYRTDSGREGDLRRYCSDEQLSRAQRVVEHEQRTSITIFAEDAADGGMLPVSVDVGDDADGSGLTLDYLSVPGMDWQSKSCPCSPKLLSREVHSGSFDGSPTHSRKSCSSNSKFSLSGSLLAIHRQASNSLRGELFNFNSSFKSDRFPSSSKSSSIRSSFKFKKQIRPQSIDDLEMQNRRQSIDEEEASSTISDEVTIGEVSAHNCIAKKPIRECHSLPALKLSRMALTYRSGMLKEELEASLVPDEESMPEVDKSMACGYASAESAAKALESAVYDASGHCGALPDLIPVLRSSHTYPESQEGLYAHAVNPQNQFILTSSSPYDFNSRDGVINLGFDGYSESSDFSEINDVVNSTRTISRGTNDGHTTNIFIGGANDETAPAQNTAPRIHGMSVGYLTSANAGAAGFDVPATSVMFSLDGGAGNDEDHASYEAGSQLASAVTAFGGSGDTTIMLSQPQSLSSSNVDVADQCAASTTSAMNSNISTAPSTAPCSPSALRVRVMDDKPNVTREQQQQQALFSVVDSRLLLNNVEGGNQLRPEHEAAVSRPLIRQEQQLNTVAEGGTTEVAAELTGAQNKFVQSDKMGELRPRPPPPPPQPPPPPAEELDEELNSSLQEARALVYWWQRSGDTDDEYCSQQGECGKKKRPLLLFVHGVGGSADDWHHQLWYFVSHGYEVMAPDLLGHGYSSAPDRAACYRFTRLLGHLRLLYNLFVPRGRKCVLLGHGYGCALVTALSRCRPSSVPMMVLASCGGPSPLLPPPSHTNSTYYTDKNCDCADDGVGEGCERHHHPYFRLEGGCCGAVSDSLSECCEVARESVGSGGWSAAVRTVLSTACWLVCCLPCVCARREVVYQPRGKQCSDGALHRPGCSATPPYVLRHMLRGQRWPEGDVAFHRRLTLPVLLLHGLRDHTVPLVHMCEMEKTIPRAFLEVVGGSGHHLMTDTPTEVNAALHRFLARWRRLAY